MDEKSLYAHILNLTAPWQVKSLTLDENAIQIHRLEIYAAGNEERTFVPLLAMGEEIR